MLGQKRTKTAEKVQHTLIGRQVWFRGVIWRVISAHTGSNQGSPWLTLKRGPGFEALAKVHEVNEAFN
jgi:hypothetical protein